MISNIFAILFFVADVRHRREGPSQIKIRVRFWGVAHNSMPTEAAAARAVYAAFTQQRRFFTPRLLSAAQTGRCWPLYSAFTAAASVPYRF
jgi:hypothetical protein